MILSGLDWIAIALFFLVVLAIGWWASKTSGKNIGEFFLGGRKMPWWLLGVSMVATTFSADTPNLVTGMVRESGVAKNWAWWSFLITGMVTVFIYAKLWRRSNVLTDLEFYEIRYSGKPAAFLRGFRALYLGIFFNCLIMGAVTLAAIKISAVMFGVSPVVTVVIASVAVMIYASIGGFKGVVWADFFQYSISMVGAVVAAYVAVKQPEVGSLKAILNSPALQDKLTIIPSFSDPSVFIPMLIIPIAVQWWAVWYPGSEPGGGGYVAQRMFAAKDEKNAIGATLFFNFAHYALRPWPWIIVALASLLVFPDLQSLKTAFPSIEDQYLGHDAAYPAMLTRLSPGILGLVLASLIAAYMSTISTHLNWGSSYIVNDFYSRFIKPEASEKELVLVGRVSTVVLMILAGTFSLTFLENATQAFNVLLLSGAGSGAIYLLRWFWWRVNAWTEIIAMLVAGIVGVLFALILPDALFATEVLDGSTMKLLVAVGITTITWLVSIYATKPESEETLVNFYKLIRPGGPGWKRIVEKNDIEEGNVNGWDVPRGLLCVVLGCFGIYMALFSIGNFIYGNILLGLFMLLGFSLATWLLFRIWSKLNID